MSTMQIEVGIQNFKRGTNINSIKVPDALRVRVKTGINFVDCSLGGEGFAASTVMMLTGSPGAGKTTLLMQMADAITAEGNIALYNSGEESLYQVKMVSERLDLKNGFYAGQDTMVDKLLAHADVLAKKHPGKKVFILQDSLQTLDDGKWAAGPNSATTVRCVQALVNWAKKTFNMVIFIGQVTKDGNKFAGKNTILHAVDVRGHISIDTDEKSDTCGFRLFEISKNRYGSAGIGYALKMGKKGLSEAGSYTM